MKQRLDKIIKIIDNDNLLLSYIPGSTDKVVILFSDLLRKREMFLNQIVDGHTYIFIVDKLESWGNSIDIDGIYESIKDLIKDKEVLSIGNSAGGHMAINRSGIFNVKHCLSFVPQYSIRSHILTNIHYRQYEMKIKEWKFDNVAFNENTKYTIINTTDERESGHLYFLRKDCNPGTRFVLFDDQQGFDHALIFKLRSMGLLEAIFKDFIEYGQISKGTYKQLEPYLL